MQTNGVVCSYFNEATTLRGRDPRGRGKTHDAEDEAKTHETEAVTHEAEAKTHEVEAKSLTVDLGTQGHIHPLYDFT